MAEHRRQGSGRRRSTWTVLTQEQVGPADRDGNRIHVRPQAVNFRDRKRAQNLASQVKGARVVRSGPGFWTPKRVLVAAVVVVVLAVAFCG